MPGPTTQVDKYTLLLDRFYDPEHHLWVLPISPTRVRIGMDPLGIEINGTLAHIVLAPLETMVRRGEPFGHLEAAKFVGPLIAPVSGRIAAHNLAVTADAASVERDPFHTGWLVEMDPANLATERVHLLQGAERILPWFQRKLEEYRRKGVLAE